MTGKAIQFDETSTTKTIISDDHVIMKTSMEPVSEGTGCNDLNQARTVVPGQKRKSVSFSADPILHSQSSHASANMSDNDDGNIFGKIPPELSHLEKRTSAPRPLPQSARDLTSTQRPKRVLTLDDVPDLPSRAVKEISAVNKNTVLNFNYHEVILPIGQDRILVEVRYSSLFSQDLAKLRNYTYNISNERIGIGYDFVGEIVEVGKSYSKDEIFKKGAKVYGVTNPLEKKGALQTCVIVNPNDVLLVITDEQMNKMANIDINLTSAVCPSNFEIEDTAGVEAESSASEHPTLNSEFIIPALAKFSTFGSQFCRAKQAVAHMKSTFQKNSSANILINGADTILGTNIVQLIASSLYRDMIQTFNITLVVREENVKNMKSFISRFDCGGLRIMNVLAFNMNYEDHNVSSGAGSFNYKKIPFFATEVFDCISKIVPTAQRICRQDSNKLKLDLFVDIVGSKKMFQKSLDMSRIDQINFPFKSRLEEDLKPSSIFGKSKGPFFSKLMKPKASGSSFVSFCDFALPEPAYSIGKTTVQRNLILHPWASSWTRGAANMLVRGYNYYDRTELEIKKQWVEEAQMLVEAGEFRVQIDEIVEWRDNFRSRIDRLRNHDGSVLFAVESF